MWERNEKLKVIVVEDEPRIMGMILRKIEVVVGEECEVIGTAINGTQALELIQVKRPHIVFTDIKMPVMDGLELSKAIKRKFPGVFVVIISGFSEFSFAQQAMRYGVFNYLLKPLVEEKLKETIEEIKEEIERAKVTTQRNIILPEKKRQGKISVEEIFKESKQKLFLICFNNLCFDSSDRGLIDYYTTHLVDIDWEKVLRGSKIEHDYWLVLDEYTVNQKNLIISVKEENSEKLGIQIKGSLEKLYPDMHINICTHKEAIMRDEMWLYTQRMRSTLLKCVGIDGGQVYLLEDEEIKNRPDISKIIKNRISKNIYYGLNENKKERVQLEIKEVVEYLKDNQIKQKQQEKVFIQISSIFEGYYKGYDELKVQAKEIDWLRTMSISSEMKSIEEAFFSYIEGYEEVNKKIEEKKDIQRELKEYVDQHFREIEKIEDVAEEFNYNYTYLSRLFKKITGLSMNKYITHKRIEEAKKFMKTHPGIGIQKVGEEVGYRDQHYFSRIFKGITGVSPSEYKEYSKRV